MELTLKKLSPGEKAKVIRINGTGAIRRRLLEMGVAPGCEVEVERYAPFGDPVEVKIRGYHLSLRKKEADMVEVEEGE